MLPAVPIIDQSRKLSAVFLALAVSVAPETALAGRPPSACLVPEDTLVFVSILDVPDARERFDRTGLGQMLADPALGGVTSDILRRIEQGTAPLRESVGLTTADLLAIPQGELSLAIVPRAEGDPSPVVLIDTGSDSSAAKRLVRAVVERIEAAGNKRSEKEVLETTITIFESVGRGQQNIAFVNKDDTLVWSNDVAVVERVLMLWDGRDTPTLASRPDFSSIMQRSRRHNPKPQVVWYVNPLAIFEDRARGRLDMQVALMMLPALGLDGVKGLGGALELDAGPYDSLWHAHLVLGMPREGVVALVSPKSGRMAPPDWVPADVADYVSLHWDLAGTVERLRSLFDTFRGAGTLDGFVAAMASRPLGVDVIGEALPALTGRITVVRWIEQPIRAESSSMLLALELDPEIDARELLRRAAQGNSARLMRREFGGTEYFEMVRRQRDDPPTSRGPRPSPCFGIVGGHLIVTDRQALFQTVVATSNGSLKRLADAEDFREVAAQMDQLSDGAAPVLVRFQRPAESTAAWYEPIRQQQTEENAQRRPQRGAFQAVESTMRRHPIPPFSTLQRYFPLGGGVLLDDESGLHYKGFSLKTEAK